MSKSVIIFLAAFLVLAFNQQIAMAQYTEDFRSREVLERVYTDIKGSPYLAPEFANGLVKLTNGSTFKDMPLRYDQVTNELVFKDKSGKMLTFSDPVAEFKFTEGKNTGQLFRSGFSAIDGNSQSSFYEVIYDGATLLIKDPRKNIVEHRAYNSSTAVKSIVETPAYYLVIDGQLTKIKKDKKAIMGALGKKSAELDKYITENKINVKEDGSLAKLIQYYDSIKI